MPPQTYTCNCRRFCRGRDTNVSKSTYYSHLPHRNPLGPVSPRQFPRNHTAPRSVLHGPYLPGPTQASEVQHNEASGTARFLDGIGDRLVNEGLGTQFGGMPPETLLHQYEQEVPLSPDAPRALDSPVPPLNAAPLDADELVGIDFVPRTDDLKISLEFVRALGAASLENGDLDEDQLYTLRNPVEECLDIEQDDLILSLKLFLSTSNSSERVYKSIREDINEMKPEGNILSLEAVKKQVELLSGVQPIDHHMCPNSCVAYTGPFADLDACPMCCESRYDPILLQASNGRKKVPLQHFFTIPLGPQLQALWRTPQGAHNMKHRVRATTQIFDDLADHAGNIEEYNDIYHGREYLEAVARGDISMDDMVLMYSMDGAQLYKDKQSDCWIYIWVIYDLPPDLRYKKKHVIPGGFIPGPNNPKNTDSFLFPGLQHLAAIQKEGLRIWDAEIDRTFTSRPFFYLGGADGPGSVHFTGLVGHHGAFPCRLYCTLKGRHKPNTPHYYPALQKPHGYTVAGCDHDDVCPGSIVGGSPQEYLTNLQYLLRSRNPTDFKDRRRDTGIATISIFTGLPAKHRLPIPSGFPGDLMHTSTLNMGELLLPLWRGTFKCAPTDKVENWDWATLVDEVWIEHGAAVASCRKFIPTSFDRSPRNIAEKISSGYKAKEWQAYLYGLAPALLHNILPQKYWVNFCKLVYAIRLLHQRKITRTNLQEAHDTMKTFATEFEELYVQRRVDRLHMVRPCLHALLHTPGETERIGPAPLYSTWTMERMIGDLGGEIRLPSNPYQNLSQRGLRRCQTNSLMAAYPILDRELTHKLGAPRNAVEFADGYILLGKKDDNAVCLQGDEALVLRDFLESRIGNLPFSWKPTLTRWGRLRLPTGQIARSAWRETSSTLPNLRRARNIKFSHLGQDEYGEVQFYFTATINSDRTFLAVVRLFSRPDMTLFRESHWTVWSVTLREGLGGLVIIPLSSIQSVVAAIPHEHHVQANQADRHYFIWEQIGLEMSLLSANVEDDDDDI